MKTKEPPYTERYVRWCGRSVDKIIVYLLPDSKNIRYLKHTNLSEFQKKYYAKMYRLRMVEQNRFKVNAVKYAEDLKRFHQLQDEYLMLIDNNIRDFSDLLDYRSEQEKKMKEIDDR